MITKKKVSYYKNLINMLSFLSRFISKKVRIPTGNVKQNLHLRIPSKTFLDPSEFSRLSQDYLSKAKKALTEIHKDNENSTLEFHHSSIKFSYQNFTLVLERNFQEQSLQVLVGDGIIHTYFYEPDSERWICVSDGHLLDELLCREVTRKCQGYFNI